MPQNPEEALPPNVVDAAAEAGPPPQDAGPPMGGPPMGGEPMGGPPMGFPGGPGGPGGPGA